jgi:hypothetical protein
MMRAAKLPCRWSGSSTPRRPTLTALREFRQGLKDAVTNAGLAAWFIPIGMSNPKMDVTAGYNQR